MNFENAPFKLTREYLEVMGGVDSPAFKQFEDHFVKGFYALQKHVEGLSAIVQLFYGDRRKNAADGIKSRLMFAQSQADVLSLIRDSFDNWRTKQYDWFQQKSNNILM
jgi:phosphatidylinositol 4-kinase B